MCRTVFPWSCSEKGLMFPECLHGPVRGGGFMFLKALCQTKRNFPTNAFVWGLERLLTTFSDLKSLGLRAGARELVGWLPNVKHSEEGTVQISLPGFPTNCGSNPILPHRKCRPERPSSHQCTIHGWALRGINPSSSGLGTQKFLAPGALFFSSYQVPRFLAPTSRLQLSPFLIQTPKPHLSVIFFFLLFVWSYAIITSWCNHFCFSSSSIIVVATS